MQFVIPCRLPGLNDYISALDYNKYKGHSLKQSTEQEICLCISVALSKGTLKPIQEYPVRVIFEWHERNRKRDLDNIVSAKKFILDAMQKSGIIKGDGQKYIGDINDIFCIPSDQDAVVVYIERFKKK